MILSVFNQDACLEKQFKAELLFKQKRLVLKRKLLVQSLFQAFKKTHKEHNTQYYVMKTITSEVFFDLTSHCLQLLIVFCIRFNVMIHNDI